MRSYYYDLGKYRPEQYIGHFGLMRVYRFWKGLGFRVQDLDQGLGGSLKLTV